MAVIRFQVEVDSDIYPELYARLSAISSPAARGERVRQLAASGLVWEVVRMHGPAATAEPQSPSAIAAAVSTAMEPTPAPQTIDLAISAAPSSAALPHEPRRHHVPVLMDVVGDDAVVSPDPRAARARVMALHVDQPVTADGPPLPPPLHTEVHTPTPRSKRMKRMVDRGLFRNG